VYHPSISYERSDNKKLKIHLILFRGASILCPTVSHHSREAERKVEINDMVKSLAKPPSIHIPHKGDHLLCAAAIPSTISPKVLLLSSEIAHPPTPTSTSAMEAKATNSQDKIVLLHGDLDLHIMEARRLPNMDMFSERLRRCFASCQAALPCTTPQHDADPNPGLTRHHHPHVKIITSDPYVTVSVAGAIVARTRVIPNSECPKWDERFSVPLAHRTTSVEFLVKDNDTFGAQLIGTVTVPVQLVLSGCEVSDWFPVVGTNGKQYKPDTALHVSLKFWPVEENPAYRNGIAGDPEHKGVKDAYFPLRHGSEVTLYQVCC
jgi:C2 domain